MPKVDSDRAASEETQARGFRVKSMIKDYQLRFLPMILNETNKEGPL